MARGFGTTFGTASDFITSGTINIAQLSTLSIWINPRSAGGFGFGYIITDGSIGSGSAEYALSMNNSTTSLLFQRHWANNPNWTFPLTPGANVWSHVAVTYDGGAVGNNPICYVNGVSQAVARALPPSGSISTANSPVTLAGLNGLITGNVYDGKIAEAALYNGVILTPSEILALAKGVPARKVRSAALSLYLPLYGLETNEKDWGPSRFATTVTGAKFQPHAPVSSILRRAA